MDKGIAKSVLHDHGLPVAAWRCRVALCRGRRGHGGSARRAGPSPLRQAGQPRIVHRRGQGLRRGCPRRRRAFGAFEFDDHVILEEFVRGPGARAGDHGQRGRPRARGQARSSPAASSTTTTTSTSSGRPRRSRPTDLTHAQLGHTQRVATAAYRALRVEGLARVDLFLTTTTRSW